MTNAFKTASVVSIVFVLSACTKNSASNLNIVNGSNVTGTSLDQKILASTVGLQIPTKKGISICTGTLIAENVIVSAGHCFIDSAGQASVSMGQTIGQVFGRVTKAVVHPQYSLTAKAASNDISVLVFEGKLPSGAKPVSIASSTNPTSVVIAGYGLTDSAKKIGSGTLRRTSMNVVRFANKQIVLNSVQNGACNGDSGGPAFVVFGDELQVIGATSSGNSKQCNTTTENYYTDVRQYVSWMQQATGVKLGTQSNQTPKDDEKPNIADNTDDSTADIANTGASSCKELLDLPARGRTDIVYLKKIYGIFVVGSEASAKFCFTVVSDATGGARFYSHVMRDDGVGAADDIGIELVASETSCPSDASVGAQCGILSGTTAEGNEIQLYFYQASQGQRFGFLGLIYAGFEVGAQDVSDFARASDLPPNS